MYAVVLSSHARINSLAIKLLEKNRSNTIAVQKKRFFQTGFFQKPDNRNSMVITVNGITKKEMVFERIKNIAILFFVQRV